MRKLSQKNLKAWDKAVIAMMSEFTGQAPKDRYGDGKWLEWQLETRYGRLDVTLHCMDGIYSYSLYSRFAEPQRSKKLYGVNPYSGKYNWLVSGADSVETAIEVVRKSISNLLVTNHQNPKTSNFSTPSGLTALSAQSIAIRSVY